MCVLAYRVIETADGRWLVERDMTSDLRHKEIDRMAWWLALYWETLPSGKFEWINEFFLATYWFEGFDASGFQCWKVECTSCPCKDRKLLIIVVFGALFQLYSISKLELESNLGEIYQLIASLSVVVSQLNLTKLNLEYLKFGC